MTYIPLLLFGLLVIGLGLVNWKGNISTIHWYHRRKVSAEDVPLYGRAMGLGTMVIGASLALTAVLQMLFDVEAIFYLALVGFVVGMIVMLYAQFKYNKGIF